jgi:hypothetical protein
MGQYKLASWVVAVILCAGMALGAEKVSEKREGPFGVPDDDAVAKATRLIKQTFAAEYVSATTLPQRAALAQRLLKEAIDTRDDLPARYALLCEARDLAAKAADAATACRAIELLSQGFGVAAGEMTFAALSTAQRVALTPPNQESLAHAALLAVDQALSKDDYDLAARLAALAEGAAERAKKIVLLTDAQEKVKEAAWAAHEFERAKTALETLTTKPDDAEARAAAGRFKCLVKNDWERGLPLLVESADAQLKLLAERDQAAQTADAVAQAKVGDQWWELGEQHLQRARLACRTRAAYWYKKAVPKLTGLSKTTAEKRLDEVDLGRLREMHLELGLSAEIFEGQKFEKSLAKRVDGRIDFEWPGAPGEGLPKDDFSIRWTGYLRAPATGKYGLTLFVNEGGRVFIDDHLAVEELKGTMKRKGTSTTISLTEGMHSIRIEFWDAGGLAKVRLAWRVPGSINDDVIPARAFVHEIGR